MIYIMIKLSFQLNQYVHNVSFVLERSSNKFQ
ncbi:Uncharacterised protein [Providencia heimbachae]|nr:Uncharacterised protein [Providencia heimbachae]